MIHWWAWSGAVCVAIWSAEAAGRRWGVADHPAIVIDEVVGLWLAVLIPLTLIPLPIEHGGWLLLGAFALFRVFDIASPGLLAGWSDHYPAVGAWWLTI